VADEVDHSLGADAEQLEVLGRDGVGDLHRILGPVHEHADAGLAQRRLDVALARRGRHQRCHLRFDGVGDSGIPGDQPRQALGPVLGLHDDVDGREHRVDRGVGDDDDFRRAGERRRDADQALPGDLALGHRHVDVARPDDHVDGRDRFGAVGEGGDGLGAADRVDGVGAGDGRCCQHDVGHGAVGPGRDAHDDRPDAGHLGGDHRHEHRRRVHRPPTGHVAPGAVDGPAQGPGGDAAGVVDDVGGPLGHLEGADRGGGRFEGGHELGLEPGHRRVPLLTWHRQRGRADAVEPLRERQHGVVATVADRRQDLPHRGDGLAAGRVGAGQPAGQVAARHTTEVEPAEHAPDPTRHPRSG
jgi:hypothetical protein